VLKGDALDRTDISLLEFEHLGLGSWEVEAANDYPFSPLNVHSSMFTEVQLDHPLSLYLPPPIHPSPPLPSPPLLKIHLNIGKQDPSTPADNIAIIA
jgi:hypothetical protein